MKEKIFGILYELIFADNLAATWKIKCYKASNKIENLVNQEVERRINGILPTDKEGQVASFKRYNLHATVPAHQHKQAAFFLGWRMCLDEIRSRLINPGEQKTEGEE